MPLYEYYCPDCKLKTECIKPIEQHNSAINCPFCGHKAERAVSVTALYSNGASGGSSCGVCSTTSCGSCR
jgi:putative FmdB family regulatory protein